MKIDRLFFSYGNPKIGRKKNKRKKEKEERSKEKKKGNLI